MSKRKAPGPAARVGRPGQDTIGGPSAPVGRPLISMPLAARKPMARVVRITLFEREIRERLSGAALDLVFARAELLSEGQRVVRGGAKSDRPEGGDEPARIGTGPHEAQSDPPRDSKNGYVGSTMLTIDLSSLSDVLRDACDAATAHRVAELMRMDGTVPDRIRDIAEREATRVAAAKLKDLRTQISVRAQGAKVFIDVDVEAGL
jgi:hypothetical protein